MDESKKKALTDAQKRANAKFKAAAYDRVELSVPKGRKDEIKAHAAKYQKEVGAIGTAGYTPKGSMNAFINRAIDETMGRDKSGEG